MKCLIQELTFFHDDHPVFYSQSLDLEGPGLVALFGPNGGGKTTLIKLLAGVEKPFNGLIRFDKKAPKELYPKIAWVPQLFQVDPLFPISVREIVEGGTLQFPRSERETRIQEALKLMDMNKEIGTDFAALSGGQKARVLFARALASRPKVLLLDEVTAHLDVSAKQSLFSLLQALKKEMLIFLVTHELEIAKEYADYLVFVDKRLEKLEAAAICNHFTQGLYHPPLSGDRI